VFVYQRNALKVLPIYLADDIHLVSEVTRQSFRSSSDNVRSATYVVCATALETEALALSASEFNSLSRGLRTLDISYKHFKTFYISTLEILLFTYVLIPVQINIYVFLAFYNPQHIVTTVELMFYMILYSLVIVLLPVHSYGRHLPIETPSDDLNSTSAILVAFSCSY